jgi:hypothetical protein
MRPSGSLEGYELSSMQEMKSATDNGLDSITVIEFTGSPA